MFLLYSQTRNQKANLCVGIGAIQLQSWPYFKVPNISEKSPVMGAVHTIKNEKSNYFSRKVVAHLIGGRCLLLAVQILKIVRKH